MKVKRIAPKVWKFTGTDVVNCYFLEDRKMMVDLGNRADREELRHMFSKVADPYDVRLIVLTHLHYDHCGNLDLFPNAEVHISEEAHAMFQLDPFGSVLDEQMAEKLKVVDFKILGEEIEGLEVIDTPGHAAGSICLWDPDRKVLFTGDFTFGNKRFGRTDLPTSDPDAMPESTMRLIPYNFRVLAPGHDYEMEG